MNPLEKEMADRIDRRVYDMIMKSSPLFPIPSQWAGQFGIKPQTSGYRPRGEYHITITGWAAPPQEKDAK